MSLEKDPAGHTQQTASDDRVAPAPPHSTRAKYKQRLARAREGYAVTVQEVADGVGGLGFVRLW